VDATNISIRTLAAKLSAATSVRDSAMLVRREVARQHVREPLEEVVGAPAARRQDVEQPLGIQARPDAEHHRLGGDDDVGHGHRVVDDLDHVAGARRPHVVDLARQHGEHGTTPVEDGSVPADEEDQTAGAGLAVPRSRGRRGLRSWRAASATSRHVPGR
jgi:hypothetical protein